ncbi:MAG: cysteine desulfurase family protein [Patescibacteria group bacterium]
MKSKRVYLDNAATTPTDSQVIKAMLSYLGAVYGNAGAFHEEGVRAKKALSDAREKTARLLQVRKEEIIFTSGGTEGDNLAIQGIVKAARKNGIKKPHIVTTAFEHSAVLETCKALEASDEAEVTYVYPEKNGIVSADKIKKAVKKNTVLVSIMHANNEIGVNQPIKEIARAILESKRARSATYNLQPATYPLVHTDACQSANYLDICPSHLGLDLMTLAGSKIYGPKGSGVLYVKHGTPIESIFYGGEQEAGLRPGTEPVYLSVGFAKALEIVSGMKEKESKRLIGLRNYFVTKLLALSPRIHLNGDSKYRLPNNISVCIDGIDNEFFVIQLDNAGIACSTRSACKTNDDKGSHVILAIGKSEKEAKESIRFSLGRSTTKKEINYTLDVIKKLLTNN